MTTSYSVTIVRCGLCRDEKGNPSPGRLGEVRRWPSGLVRWGVEDRRGQFPEMGGRGQKLVAWTVLRHPNRPDYTPPDTLPAHCERHGWGRVSTADVLTRRPSIVLNFLATS